MLIWELWRARIRSAHEMLRNLVFRYVFFIRRIGTNDGSPELLGRHIGRKFTYIPASREAIKYEPGCLGAHPAATILPHHEELGHVGRAVDEPDQSEAGPLAPA